MNRRHLLCAIGAAPLWLASPRALAAATPDAAAIVSEIAARTRALHHDAELGGAVADRLDAALRAGAFADTASPDQLSERINAEIQAATRDGHFMVMPGTMHGQPVPPTPPHGQPAPLTQSELAYLRRQNFGLAAAELLEGNIARLDLRQFYRPAGEVRARLAEAMRFLSDSSGFIVDLSRNIGGDVHAVALLLSYFFDRPPFVVNRFRWRRHPVEEFRTTDAPGGPIYGEERPLAVILSASSFSAAEEFAYDVQALRRGTVVGERSGGGANHSLPVPIAGGFTAFIPQARAENPVTGTNWEGSGVTPDLPAERTVAVAHAHVALLEHVATSPDTDRAAQARRALDRLAG